MTTFLISLGTFLLGLLIGWYLTKKIVERAFKNWSKNLTVTEEKLLKQFDEITKKKNND